MPRYRHAGRTSAMEAPLHRRDLGGAAFVRRFIAPLVPPSNSHPDPTRSCAPYQPSIALFRQSATRMLSSHNPPPQPRSSSPPRTTTRHASSRRRCSGGRARAPRLTCARPPSEGLVPLSGSKPVLLPLVKEVCLGGAEIHNLGAAVPVLLLLRTLFAVVGV